MKNTTSNLSTESWPTTEDHAEMWLAERILRVGLRDSYVYTKRKRLYGMATCVDIEPTNNRASKPLHRVFGVIHSNTNSLVTSLTALDMFPLTRDSSFL